MAEKTPDNFGYSNMTAEYRMKYKKLMEQTKAKQKNKKKNNETLIEKMSRILYGGSSK